MSVPIAVWIAAGLGAAGIKLYMDMRDVKQIVENSQARYEDEKYNYYQTQKALLPLLLLAGNLKLEMWQSFERIADALEQIDNLPRQFKYMTFETFRMGKPERDSPLSSRHDGRIGNSHSHGEATASPVDQLVNRDNLPALNRRTSDGKCGRTRFRVFRRDRSRLGGSILRS